MAAGKIKVTEAEALLHVSDQFVRIGMQRGILPIGTALKMSTKWTYQISEKLLAEYSGADVAAELEQIRRGDRMTTVDDILQLIDPSDRLRIVKDGKDLFVGYVGAYKLDSEKQLQDTFGSCEVKKFRAVPELRHKDWKKRGLASPLKPDETPDYYFADLQSTLYYTIHI